MTPQEFDQYIAQVIPGLRKTYDRENNDSRWIDDTGFGKDIKAMQLEDLYTGLSSMQNNAANPNQGNPGMSLTDDRLKQILQGAGQGGFSNFSQIGNYLTPQEKGQFDTWKNWMEQENADLDMFTYAPLIGGAVLGGYALAPGMFGAEAAAGLSGMSAADIAAQLASLEGGVAAGGAGGFVGGASGGALAGEGAAALTGGASGAGVSGAVGGGLSGAAGAGLGAGALVAGETALSRILSGTATAADWAQIAGGVGSAGLGMLGANAQGKAYSDVADKYLGLGAPYRDKLAASYAPGFSMADQPDFMNALDIGAQAAARATSARHGNPIDNPGAYSEMQKFISGSLALPQLNTYRSQLGSFGQLGTNTAGTNDTQAAGQVGGMYNAAGYGLGQLTQPKNPYEDAMKGLLGGFKLNNGYSF